MKIKVVDFITNEEVLNRDYNGFALSSGIIRFDLGAGLIEDLLLNVNSLYNIYFENSQGETLNKKGVFNDYQYSESTYQQADEQGNFTTKVGATNNSLMFRI